MTLRLPNGPQDRSKPKRCKWFRSSTHHSCVGPKHSGSIVAARCALYACRPRLVNGYHPVLATDGPRSQRPLRGVVVDLQAAIARVQKQRLPLVQSVVNRLAGMRSVEPRRRTAWLDRVLRRYPSSRRTNGSFVKRVTSVDVSTVFGPSQ